MVGTVASLHAGGAGLMKESVPSLTLLAGYGALGDRHAGKDPDRAVLVTPASLYLDLGQAGISLRYGVLGENLVVEGLELHGLPRGTRLEIGEVVLELTGPCSVCSSLSAIHPRLPKLALGKRGVYARVLRGGTLNAGETEVRMVQERKRPLERKEAGEGQAS